MFHVSRRRRPTISALMLAPVLLFGLAACASPATGEASTSAEGSTSSGADQQTDLMQYRLDFAQCMRDEGVDMPDPEAGAPNSSGMLGEDIDPELLKAAAETCSEKLGDPPAASEDEKQSGEDAFEEFIKKAVKCYRDKGYDIEDPAEGEAPEIPADAPQDVVNECGGVAAKVQ